MTDVDRTVTFALPSPDLPTELSGTPAIVDRVDAELGSSRNHGTSPALRIRVSEEQAPGQLPTALGRVSVDDRSLQLVLPAQSMTVQVDWTSQPRQVDVWMDPPRSLEGLRRLRNRSYLDREGRAGYAIVNGVMEWMWLCLKADVTLVHAASVAHEGAAHLLVSAGGIGKTSSMLHLVRQHGCSFVSDDIVPVSSDGRAVPYPRAVMIYPYNLDGDEDLAAAIVGDAPIDDRLAWSMRFRLKGSKGVSRRVAPRTLFDSVANEETLPLGSVNFLTRADGPFEVREAKAEEIAERSMQIIATEYESYLAQVRLARAAGLVACPSVESVLEHHRDVVASAFARAPRCCLVSVPHDMGPKSLAAALADEFGA